MSSRVKISTRRYFVYGLKNHRRHNWLTDMEEIEVQIGHRSLFILVGNGTDFNAGQFDSSAGFGEPRGHVLPEIINFRLGGIQPRTITYHRLELGGNWPRRGHLDFGFGGQEVLSTSGASVLHHLKADWRTFKSDFLRFLSQWEVQVCKDRITRYFGGKIGLVPFKGVTKSPRNSLKTYSDFGRFWDLGKGPFLQAAFLDRQGRRRFP